MKKFYSIFLGAVFSLLAVSCFPETEQEAWTPGEAEDAFCYGVYFPVQDASGYHIYNPTQDPKVVITVGRTNTSGAITVPIEATFSEEGIFEVAPIAFEDGQAETTFTVSFPTAKEGTEYSASFNITDKTYASLYSSNAVGLDFSFMRVEMKDFLTEDKSKKAMLTFTDDVFWGEVHDDVYLQYYEVDGIRYCETTGGKLVSPADASDGTGPWGTDVQLKFKWYTNVQMTIGEEEYDFIEVECQYHGWDNATRNSQVWFADYYNYYQANASTPYNGDAIKFFTNNGDSYPPCYYDGHGGFIFNLAYYMPTSGGYWYGFQQNAPVAIAEGYLRVDYGLKIAQAGVPNAGKVPVNFTLGADVAKVVYEFKEGELSNINTERAISELKADSENAVTATGVYAFELEKTGVYTLVAAAVDAGGKIQNTASTLITYTSAADVEEKATVISGGISSAEKYVPQGVNPDTALEVYIYGTDIVDAKFAVFSMLDLAGDAAGCQAALLASESVEAEVLDLINGEGYVDVVTGLLPGTEYYLMVYASNGYTETVELYGSATTSGDPLPIYQTFTIDSYDPTYELENAAAWLGTWNYYAVDYYGSTGLREYLGKVNITASETPTEGPDDDGNYDEYVVVDGLFPNAVVDGPAYGYETGNCKLEMDVYGGAMYAFAATTLDGVCTIHTYAKAAGGFYNGVSYYAAFIPVLDGYYAMVDVAGSQYDFCGLRVVQSYVWDAFYDMLLIDPAKDDLAPSSVKVAVDNARKLYKESAAEFDNAVMSPKGRVSAIAESYKEKMNSVRAYNTVAGVKGERPVKSATVKSVTYRGVSTSRSISDKETRL